MPIKENRIINIDNKIISLVHLRELGELLVEEFRSSLMNDSESRLIFSVKCFEPSSFESEDISIFEENSIINKKRIKAVTMSFSGDQKSIVIRLNHGWKIIEDERFSDADVEISGNNPFWVSGLTDKLSTSINAFPLQSSPVITHSSKIKWAAFLIGTFTFGFLVDVLNKDTSDFTPYWSYVSSGDLLASILLAALLGGSTLVMLVSSYISKAYDLWPTIELQIGPEHSFAEKRRRRLLFMLMTIFIIPMAISIISGVITS